MAHAVVASILHKHIGEPRFFGCFHRLAFAHENGTHRRSVQWTADVSQCSRHGVHHGVLIGEVAVMKSRPVLPVAAVQSSVFDLGSLLRTRRGFEAAMAWVKALVLFGFCAALAHAESMQFDFGLVIDAGSQGTRIYVYRWCAVQCCEVLFTVSRSQAALRIRAARLH